MIEIESSCSEENNRLNLYWNQLSYKTENNKKTIINELNGEISSGQLCGILGPSGCGKTTLIECLAGKRKAGMSGRVWAKRANKDRTHLRMSYNAQTDALIDELTVEEALQYASELKKIQSKRYDFFDNKDVNYKNNRKHRNANSVQIDECLQLEPLANNNLFSHQINVKNMIEVFALDQCSAVRTASISGGQKKRLSIALELIFSPNILLLDEPTTGLDSKSSFQCLSLLKTLSYNKEPLVIAASIHQPTARLLNFFDVIYVLSLDGQCIYSGRTDKLIKHLSAFDLICPIFHNPADYVIEISSGGHGNDAIENLVKYEKQKILPKITSISKHEMISFAAINECQRTLSEQIVDLWIIMKRSALISIRNPLIYWLRILGLIFSLLAKLVVFGGQHSGQISTDVCSNSSDLMLKMRSIATKESSIHKSLKSIQNISYIITLTMFIHFMTICPTLMTFPTELNTFVKEHFNKWYTSWSYFMAKSLTDLPAVVVIPVIYATFLWIITDQTLDVWRFSIHLVVILLLALVSHSMGLLLSAFFINNIRASLLSFTIFMTPFMLFSGFLIPIRVMPRFLQLFSYLSIFRLTYESMLILIYGFSRCSANSVPLTFADVSREFGVNMVQMNECLEEADSLANLTQNGLNAFNRFLLIQNPSKMLDYFNLRDSDLYINIALLVFYSLALRMCAYYALKLRVRVK